MNAKRPESVKSKDEKANMELMCESRTWARCIYVELALGRLHEVIRVRVGEEDVDVELEASVGCAGLQRCRVR